MLILLLSNLYVLLSDFYRDKNMLIALYNKTDYPNSKKRTPYDFISSVENW